MLDKTSFFKITKNRKRRWEEERECCSLVLCIVVQLFASVFSAASRRPCCAFLSLIGLVLLPVLCKKCLAS